LYSYNYIQSIHTVFSRVYAKLHACIEPCISTDMSVLSQYLFCHDRHVCMIDMSRTLHESRYHTLCHELYIIHLDDTNPWWMIYMSQTLHESRYHTLCHELYIISVQTCLYWVTIYNHIHIISFILLYSYNCIHIIIFNQYI